ncbi:LXG domain-containing protein [Fictibacillus sp. Mic-4]|uniref:ribonuclease YeeF family protein n=1 Tax=Fictibacillus sp. Mic-4 TaxID=3132826 RepID=UPI003CFAA589
MKRLDVQKMHLGIDEIMKQLGDFNIQIKQLQNAVNGIIALEDSLKGKTGQAIRTFYQECHLPFLLFFEAFIEDYISTLKKMKQALQDFEPAQDGFIDELFLEHNILRGLQKIEETTIDLTEEANKIMRKVDDIIYLPRLNNEDVLGGIHEAKMKYKKTIEELNRFDYEQTKALNKLQHDVDTMENYIRKIESMFQNGDLDVSTYSARRLSEVPMYNKLVSGALQKSDIELLPMNPTNSLLPIDKLLQAYSFSSADLNLRGRAYYSGVENNKFSFWDTPGIGNFNDELKADRDQLKYKFESSFLDTDNIAGAIVDKKNNVTNYGLNSKLFTASGEINLPISEKEVKKDLYSGAFIGGKAEATFSESTFKHPLSPTEVKLKVGTGEMKAGIENYSIGAGAEVSAVKVETKKELFTFFGYSPLKEWFGISPYVGFDVSLGGYGIGGSLGLENEIYAADQIGVGIKWGVDIEGN